MVLARKYRSRSFDELVGQEHVVKALTNALTQGRLHHAYLFTGTRGVGKTSVSRILAKSLNCVGPDGQGGITAHPCGVCHPCRDIDAGRFIDYVELDAASNRGVDEISTLLDQSVYKPVTGRFKVYLIDEVHMLTAFAFNAMLKTLEEPPDYLKFILATTDPQKVPPTVLSRCLQFNLRPMAPQTVQQHLVSVLADEAIPAEPGALRLLSRAARGSMRDALSLADQAIAYGAGVMTEAGVREMLGAVDRGHAVRIVEALAASDGAGLVAAADELRGLGLSAAGTLDELTGLLQQMAVTQAVPDSLDDTDPEATTVRRLAPLLNPDELQLFYSMALHGRAEIGLAPDEYSGLVMVLLRMLAFRPGKVGPQPTRQNTAEVAVVASVDRPAARTLPETQPDVTTAVSASPAPATPARSSASAAPSAAPAAVRPAPIGPDSSNASGATIVSGVPVSTMARGAALRASPTTAARVLVASASNPPSTGDRVFASVRNPSGPVLAAQDMSRSTSAHGVASAVKSVDTANSADATSTGSIDTEAVDFGEPPPWLDVPFDSDEDVAAMAPSARRSIDLPVAVVESTAVEPPTSPVVASSRSLASAPVVTTALGDRWAALVDQMTQSGSIAALTRELALQSECVQAGESGLAGDWRLRVERESLRAPGLVEKLRTAMTSALGGEVRLEVERGPAIDSPALRNSAERERRQREAERLIHDDPLVKSMLAQFKTARIVPGSIKSI